MGERAQRRAQAAHADPHLVDAIRVGASHDADLVAVHLRQAIAHNAPNPFLAGISAPSATSLAFTAAAATGA